MGFCVFLFFHSSCSSIAQTSGDSGFSTPERRASKKMTQYLGIEAHSPTSEDGADSPTKAVKLQRKTSALSNIFQKSVDRKRSSSTTVAPRDDSDEESASLRARVSELELQVYSLEAAAQEREQDVEHYRAKCVAMKQTNRGIRDQARSMFKALLAGDSRKLDELIRNHYNQMDPTPESVPSPRGPDELAEEEEEKQLTPRGTHFRAPDVAHERSKGYRARDMMFLSQGSIPVATRKIRGSSDPREVSSPAMSPKALRKASQASSPGSVGSPRLDLMDLSAAGSSIEFVSGSHEIARGTVPDICDFLINVNRERGFLARFLLLYRQFMPPADLLAQLERILKLAPESERSASEDEDTVLYIQPMPGSSTVKQRVGYLMNRWLQDYFDADFRDNSTLRKSFAQVAQGIDPGLLVLLDTAWEKSKESRRASLSKQGQSLPSFSHALGTMGRNKTSASQNSINLLSLHPMEVAHQMTLIDFDLLDSVEPLDFLKASKDSNKATTVKGLTNHFNQTSAWVATEIIMAASPKERALKIRFFISVAQAALEIKNFNLLMSMLAGINYSSVQRLKKTWKLVPQKLVTAFQQLEELMSSSKNYQTYRTALSDAEYPKLPYFGVFLRDLQFIDVGNDTWIGGESVVNFEKVTMMEALLQELDNFKTYNEFPWTAISSLQSYLKIIPSLDEEALHKASVQAEPITTTGVNYLADEDDTAAPLSSPKRGAGSSPRREGLLSPKKGGSSSKNKNEKKLSRE